MEILHLAKLRRGSKQDVKALRHADVARKHHDKTLRKFTALRRCVRNGNRTKVVLSPIRKVGDLRRRHALSQEWRDESFRLNEEPVHGPMQPARHARSRSKRESVR